MAQNNEPPNTAVKPIQLTEKNGILQFVHEAAEVLGISPGTLARQALDLGMKTPEMRNLLKAAGKQRPAA